MMFTPDGSLTPIETGQKELPSCFSPGEYDVICGKGKSCFLHPGNKWFRKLVGLYLDSYSHASTKLEKTAIVSTVLEVVRSRSQNGGFVKLNPATGIWQEVDDNLAREKVGQTIRDALHTTYKSSTKAKKERRQAEQARACDSISLISSAHCKIASKIHELTAKVTKTQSDRQTLDMFTQANLEILNELNRLNQSGSAHQVAHSSNAIVMPPEAIQVSEAMSDSQLIETFAANCASLQNSFPSSFLIQQLLTEMSSNTEEQSQQIIHDMSMKNKNDS